MSRAELRRSFFIVWLVLSGLGAAVLAAPVVLSEQAIMRLAPVCERKAKYNRECPLCGMTRSFLRLSRGDLAGASQANAAGPALAAVFLVNPALAALLLVRRRQRRGSPPAEADLPNSNLIASQGKEDKYAGS